MKTVVGLYEESDNATRAVQQLERAGFAESSVRMLDSVNAIWQHLGCTPGRIMVKGFAIGTAFGIAGQPDQPFDVLAFDEDGNIVEVFASHP